MADRDREPIAAHDDVAMNPGPTRRLRRQRLIERDGMLCALCGLPMGRRTVTIDHILPKSLGGTNDMANLRLAHKKCNRRRGNKLDADRDVQRTMT